MLQLMKQLKKRKVWQSENGLTMLELLTTIAILGIVAAIASPIIISMIQQAQIDAYKGELSYVSDSSYKMINGTAGEPAKAAADITSDGDVVPFESLGPYFDESGGVAAASANGYWFDISQMSLPFDVVDESALILWENSRIVRVVPKQSDGSLVSSSNGDPAEVMADACITAWVGDANVVIESLRSSEVTIVDGSGYPCGLIPGPIEPPDAPSPPSTLEPLAVDTDRGDDTSVGSMSVTGITPPDDLGGDSSDLSINEYRVTCTNEAGHTRQAQNATQTMTLTGLIRGTDYTCTAAVTTNAYPGYSPESGPSSVIRMPEAPNEPTNLTGTVGTGGVLNLGWNKPTDDGCNEPGVDEGNVCGSDFNQTEYELQYVLGIDGTSPSSVTDSDFTNANTLPLSNVTQDVVSYVLSNANIQNHNTITGDTLDELVNGNTYYIRVRAINSETLKGPWSDSIVEQTATEPDAITPFLGEDGAGQVTFRFDVPYNGGLPIQEFEIWWDINDTFDSGDSDKTGPDGTNRPLGSTTVVCSDTSDPNYVASVCTKSQGEEVTVTIPNLPDSTSYFGKIFTENEMGMSAWSDPATPVATYAPAEAPESTDATIDDSGNATVTWQ